VVVSESLKNARTIMREGYVYGDSLVIDTEEIYNGRSGDN
jgi:hypothetical protein